MPVSLVVAMVAVGRVVLPVVVITLLYVVGVVLVRRTKSYGVLVLAVPSALLIVRNGPILVDTLAMPAETVDFLSHAVAVTLAAANLVAAVMTLSRRTSGKGAPIVAAATAALLASVVVVAIVAMVVQV